MDCFQDETKYWGQILKVLHSEKRFDWMKENHLFERLSLIQRNDLFELNKICLM